MKKFFLTLYKLHRWSAWFAAIPSLIIIITGLVLSLRQTSAWIQPPIQKGTPGIPTLSLTKAFEIAQTIPDAQIHEWKDLKSVEIKPAQGVICMRSGNGFEVQIDGSTGKILSTAPRRTTWIIALHEGSYFHPVIRWGIFFASALLLFVLSCTGIGILSAPYLKRIFR